MKKVYISPETELVLMDNSQMIAESPIGGHENDDLDLTKEDIIWDENDNEE